MMFSTKFTAVKSANYLGGRMRIGRRRWTILIPTLLIVPCHGFAGRRNPTKRKKPYHPLPKRSDVLDIERSIWSDSSDKRTIIVGSDESGTGCIAGPIVVASCALLIEPDITADADDLYLVRTVRDSKTLDLETCHQVYAHLQKHTDIFTIATAVRSNEEIDTDKSVQKSIQNAFEDSIGTLCRQHSEHSTESSTEYYSIVDGHRCPPPLQLHAENDDANDNTVRSRPWKHADRTVYTVALASCVARAKHDECMKEAAGEYPEYDFHLHGGYPSEHHIQKLQTHGPSPIHRRSCKPVQRYDTSNDTSMTRKEAIGTIVAAVCTPSMLRLESVEAMSNDPKTGVALPDVGEIASAIPDDWSVVDSPIEGRSSFDRLDVSDDTLFYSETRFVEHVDEQAVTAMTKYIDASILQSESKSVSVLDLCSSWTSHVSSANLSKVSRFAGLGMNEKELVANKALTEYTVQDLNRSPKLPYDTNSFDIAICQLSIDYLTQPLAVCAEINRVLRPGGTVHILFSNRLFLSKAVAIWTGKDDIDHAFIVASYLKFCSSSSSSLFRNIQAIDLSTRTKKNGRIVGDPLYVVTATAV